MNIGNGPPKALIAGLWMVPSCGGMPKTIECFRRALDAEVVSFTDGRQLDLEGTAVRGAHHVRTGRGPLGRLYSWAPKRMLGEADARAARCNLISSHTLFRYHVHWVRGWVKRRKLPYWVVPHGCLDPYVFTYRAWQKRLFLAFVGRRHLRDAAHVIFSTEREREKASLIYSGPNTRVVRWPVEPMDVLGRNRARRQVRSRLGISESARILVFLGRLHGMKRPLETIRAVARAAHPELHLIMVGPSEGISRSECEATASSEGFGNLHILGGQWGAARDEVLLAADGFVSLSIRENFGHAAAEAMSAQLPLILSPGNDLAGELRDVDCGWLLHDEAADSAVNAIKEFAAAPASLREARGHAGREWVLRELSFEKFQSELASLALEATSKRQAP